MAWLGSSHHHVTWSASYTDHKEDDFRREWVHGTEEKLDPYAIGSYLGDTDFALRPTRYWSDQAARRLMAIRKKWDPNGRIAEFMAADDASGGEGLSSERAKGKFESRLA